MARKQEGDQSLPNIGRYVCTPDLTQPTARYIYGQPRKHKLGAGSIMQKTSPMQPANGFHAIPSLPDQVP